jgi:hypothetical protein
LQGKLAASYAALGRGLARRKGFGSGCEAGATNAVAIAPQPAHAQLCREVEERNGFDEPA